jgi:hypothetical protein
MTRRIRSNAIACLTLAAGAAAMAVTSTPARAATLIKSGDTIDGWKVTFPADITLSTVDNSPSTLAFSKDATFNSLEGLVITFNQISYSASPTITIVDETLMNHSGSAFSAFQFMTLNTLAGNAAPPVFQSASDVFKSTPPFTHTDFTPDTITLSQGTLNDGASTQFGMGPDGGDLVIAANPATSGLKKVFDFKEIPTPGPGTMIPLPAAGWTGLSGLIGLGVIGAARRARKLLN